MADFTLKRIASRADGTFGVLLEGDLPFALTLERQWQNNAVGASCIPLGGYLCGRVNSPKFGKTFEVKAVKGRSAILFHKGNLDDDTHGCILVGERFDLLNGEVGITASADGFGEFTNRTANLDSFTLNIEEFY